MGDLQRAWLRTENDIHALGPDRGADTLAKVQTMRNWQARLMVEINRHGREIQVAREAELDALDPRAIDKRLAEILSEQRVAAMHEADLSSDYFAALEDERRELAAAVKRRVSRQE